MNTKSKLIFGDIVTDWVTNREYHIRIFDDKVEIDSPTEASILTICVDCFKVVMKDIFEMWGVIVEECDSESYKPKLITCEPESLLLCKLDEFALSLNDGRNRIEFGIEILEEIRDIVRDRI